MVKSILDPTINYPETKNIDKEDKNYDSQVYEITLFQNSTEINIVLGQPKYTFVDKKIVYYPIYLVLNDKVTLQIGVYEIPSSDIPKVLDAEGDIDLELLNEPLLYAFTTPDILNPLHAMPSSIIQNVKNDEESSLREREEYKKKGSKPLWIQKFMENNNYKIVENEGKGDCLFAVIRDGLKSINKDVSVEQMRLMISKEVDDTLFTTYMLLYVDAQEQDKLYLEELKGLVQRNNSLKLQLAKEKDRNKQQAIITQAEEVLAKHKTISEDRKYTKAMIQEFGFMKGVKDSDELKSKMLTCEFWGNTWAISTLERLLNIKVILMSEESYKAGDVDNVLHCGQLNDDKLGETFEPTHYILTCYLGWHYQLITYKNKGALTFNEIPYDIKMLVVGKCVERMAGPYFIIPAFRDFMIELKDKKSSLLVDENLLKSTIAALTSFVIKDTDLDKNAEESSILSEKIHAPSDLYDNKTTFQFYSKSVEKIRPGHGAGENISNEEEKEGTYKELAKISHWRRKLANEWNEAPFKLDGHLWQSVEHYYQGSKFKKSHRDFYLQFSLASEAVSSEAVSSEAGASSNELSKDPFLAKATGAIDAPAKLRPKEIKVDKDFFISLDGVKRSEKELEDALRAKFTQNPELNVLLKATKKAKLQGFVRGAPPIVFNELMRVRNTF
jgi:hypothetical protein